MQLETECVRTNAKSETSQPCLSKDAIEQPKEAEKTETANTPQADALHVSVQDNDTNAVGSSK